MNKVYDKCIRTDRGTGEQEYCPIELAHRAIDRCYEPSQPVKDLLHDGTAVRTEFAIYQVVRA